MSRKNILSIAFLCIIFLLIGIAKVIVFNSHFSLVMIVLGVIIISFAGLCMILTKEKFSVKVIIRTSMAVMLIIVINMMLGVSYAFTTQNNSNIFIEGISVLISISYTPLALFIIFNEMVFDGKGVKARIKVIGKFVKRKYWITVVITLIAYLTTLVVSSFLPSGVVTSGLMIFISATAQTAVVLIIYCEKRIVFIRKVTQETELTNEVYKVSQ